GQDGRRARYPGPRCAEREDRSRILPIADSGSQRAAFRRKRTAEPPPRGRDEATVIAPASRIFFAHHLCRSRELRRARTGRRVLLPLVAKWLRTFQGRA